MSLKTAKILKILAKTLIVAAAYSYAIYKIYTAPDIKQIPTHFANLGLNEYLFLTFLLVLMPVNWFLEIKKWQQLIANIESINFWDSLKAVMCGVTVGTLTPNRVGEFAGRIMFINKENRVKATFLTLYGDLAQLCATIIFGLTGLLLIGAGRLAINFWLVLAVGFVLAAVILVLYINYEKVIIFLERRTFLQRWLKKYSTECKIPPKHKYSTIFISFLRYFVFCFQYYCALRFFGVDIGMYEAMISIFAIYLCIYIIPNVAAAELGVRTSFSMMILGIFCQNETAIALSALILYFVNVVISICCGGIFIFLKKNKKSIAVK